MTEVRTWAVCTAWGTPGPRISTWPFLHLARIQTSEFVPWKNNFLDRVTRLGLFPRELWNPGPCGILFQSGSNFKQGIIRNVRMRQWACGAVPFRTELSRGGPHSIMYARCSSRVTSILHDGWLTTKFILPFVCYNSRAHCPLLQCLRTTSAILAGTHSYFVVSSFKCEGKIVAMT